MFLPTVLCKKSDFCFQSNVHSLLIVHYLLVNSIDGKMYITYIRYFHFWSNSHAVLIYAGHY